MRRAFVLVLAIALALASGCQIVGKLETRNADPIEAGCVMPSAGDARLRLANFLPGTASVDFCIKSSSASAYARPFLRSAGLSCPAGFAFKNVSTLVPFASGAIDVKAVANDAHSCDAPAIAETKGVDLPSARGTTIFLAGGNGAPPTIFARAEGDLKPPDRTKLRFVDAVGSTPLVFGLTKDPRLPTSLTVGFTDVVAFGGVSSPRTTPFGPIDDKGYLVAQFVAPYSMGAAPEGSSNAVIALTAPKIQGWFSMFAVGDPSQTLFPVRALVCDEEAAGTAESSGAFIACAESDPPSLTVDVFSTSISGGFSPQETPRIEPVVAALSTHTADVLCVPEVGENDIRQRIIDTAKSTRFFPYAAAVDTDESTPATDPTDANGNTPPSPTTPACGDPSYASDLDSVFQCLTAQCATPPNVTNGYVRNEDIGCPGAHCSGAYAPLFAGDNGQQRCFGCLASRLVTYTHLDVARTECTTDVHAGYAFKGNSPTFILSKFPLANVEAFVLPSTTFRRSVVRAELQLDGGDSIDLYCAKLSPNLGTASPYFGPYNVSGDPAKGWADEQELQAKKLVDYVKRKTVAGRRAIIMGEFDSGVEARDANTNVLVRASTPQTMQHLVDAFASASPPGWVPVCTVCPSRENPYNGPDPPIGAWTSRIFLYNFADGATLSAKTIFKDFVVKLASGSMGPLSAHWGYSIKVLRK